MKLSGPQAMFFIDGLLNVEDKENTTTLLLYGYKP